MDTVTEFVVCNHAEKVIGDDYGNEAPAYPMITRRGEAQTRAKAAAIADKIHSLPGGSVVILSGISPAVRTRSTLAVYADELGKIFSGQAEVKVFNLAILDKFAKRLQTLKNIAKEICNGHDRGVIVIHLPLAIDRFVASPNDSEETAGQLMLAGLEELEKFFRRFFPENLVAFISVGHSIGLAGLLSSAVTRRDCRFFFI